MKAANIEVDDYKTMSKTITLIFQSRSMYKTQEKHETRYIYTLIYFFSRLSTLNFTVLRNILLSKRAFQLVSN